MHSLETRLALADVLGENVSSPGWRQDLTQPVVLAGVVNAGSLWGERFHSRTEPSELKKSAFCPTRLGQIAGITAKAICTNTDEGIVSDSGHTRPSVVAMFYITEFTCESAEIKNHESGGEQKQKPPSVLLVISRVSSQQDCCCLTWSCSLTSHPRLLLRTAWLGFSDEDRLDQIPDDPCVLDLGWFGLSRQQRSSFSAKVLSADSQSQTRSGT